MKAAVPPRTRAATPIDRLFRAFSDTTRLRILYLLRDGELCVCDLVEVMRLPQPTISRHLSYLRRTGVVKAREERSWNFYTLTTAQSAVHKRLLDCLAACSHELPQLANEASRARHLRSKGGCCPP
jgi:ArsR family transcriptional regulator, arsenate/arsenite/antimonite-responsive transcriptional repressor